MRKPVMLILAGALAVVPLACGGDDDASAGDFCDLSREFDEKFDTAEPTDAEATEALERLADAAPEEIEDDVRLIVDALDAVAEAGTDPEALAALEEEFAGTEEASSRVETYLDEECGIAPEPDAG